MRQAQGSQGRTPPLFQSQRECSLYLVVIDKIDLGEFVDLGDLLQDQMPQDDIILPDPKSGVVLVQSLESLKKKRITNFQSGFYGLRGCKIP